MRRAVVLVAGLLVLAVPPARGTTASIDVFEARAEAGGIHDSIAVPAYFETFLPYSLDEATNDSSHGYHSTFYGGFLLTAAAEQYLGQYGLPTKPPGTTETLYPQGPTTATAAFVPIPGADMGASRSSSSANGSQGTATFDGGSFGPQGSMGFGQTATSVKIGSDVRSRAEVVMHDLHLGPLVFGAVKASAEAVSAGRPGGGRVSSALSIADVTLNGMPLANVNGLGAPGPLDDVLAQAGVTITRLPDSRSVKADGTDSRIEIGGVKVTFSQPAQEFTVTWTLGHVQALARGLPGIEGPAPRPALPSVEQPLVELPVTTAAVTPPPPPAAVEPLTVGAGEGEIRRVRRASAAGTLDVTWLAASIALFAVFASLARRAFHAVASP